MSPTPTDKPDIKVELAFPYELLRQLSEFAQVQHLSVNELVVKILSKSVMKSEEA